MPTVRSKDKEKLLYSYRIASADMRFIEVNTREIYLRHDPTKGLVLRGEIPGCGSICHAGLCTIFLEYAMSCKGFEGSSLGLESIEQFGKRLGNLVASVFLTRFPEASAQEIVSVIFDRVLASMETRARQESTGDSLKFTFVDSPLTMAAEASGLKLWVAPAYQGFVAFFESLLHAVGGEWALISPNLYKRDICLQMIQLNQATSASVD